jgi:hypothetical protein
MRTERELWSRLDVVRRRREGWADPGPFAATNKTSGYSRRSSHQRLRMVRIWAAVRVLEPNRLGVLDGRGVLLLLDGRRGVS